MRFSCLTLLFVLLVSFQAFAAEGPLKPPYFASLRNEKTFVRFGPSTDYPVKWVYTKAGLPVEVTHSYDAWRKIRTPDGETGWVHYGLLSLRRTALIASKDTVMLYSDRALNKPMAKLAPAVSMVVRSCQPDVCRVETKDFKGFIRSDVLWGIYPGEEFE